MGPAIMDYVRGASLSNPPPCPSMVCNISEQMHVFLIFDILVCVEGIKVCILVRMVKIALE